MQAVDDPRVGTVLAGYRIRALLGRGGMSVVYLAEDPRLKRKRRAQAAGAPALGEDASSRSQFLRESELAASIDHPHIVPDLRGRRGRGPACSSPCATSRGATSSAACADGCLGAGRRDRDRRAGGERARRRARAGLDPPRREAVQRAARRRAPARTARITRTWRTSASPPGSRTTRGRRRTAARSAPSTTSRPSRSPATTSTVEPTCTRWPACSTSAWPGSHRSGGQSEVAAIFAQLHEEPPRSSTLRPDLPRPSTRRSRARSPKQPDERYATCRELAPAALAPRPWTRPRRAVGDIASRAAAGRSDLERDRGRSWPTACSGPERAGARALARVDLDARASSRRLAAVQGPEQLRARRRRALLRARASSWPSSSHAWRAPPSWPSSAPPAAASRPCCTPASSPTLADGVLPGSAHWPRRTLRPGDHPLDALRRTFALHAPDPGGGGARPAAGRLPPRGRDRSARGAVHRLPVRGRARTRSSTPSSAWPTDPQGARDRAGRAARRLLRPLRRLSGAGRPARLQPRAGRPDARRGARAARSSCPRRASG